MQLGALYFLGTEHIEKDPVEGYAWLKSSSNHKLPKADFYLRQVESTLTPEELTQGNIKAKRYSEKFSLYVK